MRTLWQDVRYGVRMLVKQPGFALVAVVTLALGIGANTAIFSVINAVLLRPLPYPGADRIVTLSSTDSRQGIERSSVAAPDFADWRERNKVFEDVAAYHFASFTLTGVDAPERLVGAFVTEGFARVMRVEPAHGRMFSPEEDGRGGARVAVISYDLWQRRFGGDPAALNRTITLNNESFTIIGVMPAGFRFPFGSGGDVWTPAALDYVRVPNSVTSFLSIVARLKPGLAPRDAQIEMDGVARQLAEEHPDTNEFSGVRVIPLHEQVVGDVRLPLLALGGAVCLVLLIVCANIANLLLVRAAGRQKEIAVRTALGANRLRLARQLLTESLLLALAGGALGLLLAVWGVDLLVSIMPSSVPRLKEVGVDGRALAFASLISLATGLFFGLAPAWQASQSDVSESLKEGGRGHTANARQQRFRSSLVVAQIAFAVVLLVGAGLFIKSFHRLRTTDAGFDAANVLTLQLSLPRVRYADKDQQVNFFQQTLDRVAALPGVQAAGTITNLPLGNSRQSSSFSTDDRPTASPNEQRNATINSISPDYFRAMSIPLRQGRAFTARDTAKAPGVVIVNEALARRFFAGENALGKRLTIGEPEEVKTYGAPVSREIVGVVKDVRYELEIEAKPEIYVPYTQRPQSLTAIVMRASVAPTGVIAAVRRAIQEVDPDQAVYNIKTMEQRLDEEVAQRRAIGLLTGSLGGLALLLAAVGIYGVIAYSVAQRTHEIGIRVALGAQRGNVLRLVLTQGMALTALGIAVGLTGALAVTHIMRSLLYGVTATDPLTFIGVAALLTSVALLACYIPARRATKVDPLVALRYE